MRPALLALALLATPALADRREAFVLLEVGAGWQALQDAATFQRGSSAVGPAGELHAFYGLSNSLHVGGWVRGFYAADVAFTDVTPTSADGSRPTGTLYENVLTVGAGGLARWRFDTGFAFAPFAQLELGFAWSHFSRLQLIPKGQAFSIDVPLVDELSPDGRLVVGGEYRLGERFILGVHLGVRRSLGRAAQLQLDGAVALGVVW